MPESVSPTPLGPDEFDGTPGVEDWRYASDGVGALFRTGSFAKGVALVDEIGRLADAANHHPDVELRYPTVGVRLVTHEIGAVSDRDVALARQISEAARALGIVAEPVPVPPAEDRHEAGHGHGGSAAGEHGGGAAHEHGGGAHHDPAHRHTHGGTPDDVARLHTRAYWEERYTSTDRVWSGHPNRAVVDEVVGLTPGRALDVAAGEGGDAIWLAENGWTVTALDHAQAAVDRGAAHAAARGVGDRVTWVRADARTWQTDELFDLVTSAYLHLPAGTREAWLASVATLVAPGGTLLVIAHHASDAGVVPRPDAPELFAEASELAALLDPGAWEIVTAEKRPREAADPEGRAVTVHDAVLRARRTSPS